MFLELKDRLAFNVRRLREAQGWTQEEAAHQCGMPLRLLQGIEARTDNVTLVTLSRLVEGFEVDVQDLLARPEDEKTP